MTHTLNPSLPAGGSTPPPSSLMTFKEAAADLRVSVDSVRRMTRTGKLRVVQVTPGMRGRRVTRESLDALVSRVVPPSALPVSPPPCPTPRRSTKSRTPAPRLRLGRLAFDILPPPR